jgi:hypothetical protein
MCLGPDVMNSVSLDHTTVLTPYLSTGDVHCKFYILQFHIATLLSSSLPIDNSLSPDLLNYSNWISLKWN